MSKIDEVMKAWQEDHQKVSWSDLQAIKEENEALRAQLSEKNIGQAAVMQQEAATAWQSIEAAAAQRYKVGLAHDSMFYRHAVVAGDGSQQLYIGRKTECENMARKFAGAFLDGAYLANLYTHPAPQQKPLTDAITEFNRAIDFAIEQGIEAAVFLRNWREGDTNEWPEFHQSREAAHNLGEKK